MLCYLYDNNVLNYILTIIIYYINIYKKKAEKRYISMRVSIFYSMGVLKRRERE